MRDDPRCCGSGACIIDTEGRCWCGQAWDGEKMCHAPAVNSEGTGRDVGVASPRPSDGNDPGSRRGDR